MDRAYGSNVSGAPPAVPGAPAIGYPRPGDPATATPATRPAAYWYHMVTESLRNIVVAGGLTPDHTNLNLVAQAIQVLIAQATGNDYKASVRYITTANINLNGLATQAGGDWPGALTVGDRILTAFQTTAADRCIWIASAGAWTRATDADGSGELTSGAVVAVEEGASLSDTQWMLTTDGAINIGVTALAWKRIDAGAAVGAGKLANVDATVAANALTVTIAAETLDFRSNSLTSGVPVTRTAASQGSLTVPSGATLGTVAAQLSRLVWGWVDNAGTLEPFIINLAGGANLDETQLISTTAMSGAANAANVFYSAVARANVAFKVRGFCDITEAVPGTWATAATLKVGLGGNAYRALPSVSQIKVTTSNGYGSTNTKIRRFTTVAESKGNDITYADSATLGASFTINTPGVYTFNYTESGGGGGIYFGLSLNTTQPNTSILSIGHPEQMCIANANSLNHGSWTQYFPAGSVIRPHADLALGSAPAAVLIVTRVN